MNTFCGPVLFALGLPLLLFWPQIQNRLLGTRSKNSPQPSKGEFDWIESPELLRTRMFRLLVTYQTLHGLKVSFNLELKTFVAQFFASLIERLEQCQYLSNCTPTPPLTQQQSTDNKLGFNVGLGEG